MSSVDPSSSQDTRAPQPPRLSPLDLPEILLRICQFVPLWSGEGFYREFEPRPLLQCGLVSKAFRQAALPTLWFVYDSFRMRNPPDHILSRYSHLFRIISNTGQFKGPFHCRNLIELSTTYGQEWSRELVVLNPGLKRLHWGGPYYRRIETLEQVQEWQSELKAIMGLGNLDFLKTSSFSLGEGILVKVLRNNAMRLSNLQLSTVEGVTSIEGLELPYLTDLDIVFGGNDSDSPALVDLVRCCPRLQRLTLTGCSRTRPSPTATPVLAPVAGGDLFPLNGINNHNNSISNLSINIINNNTNSSSSSIDNNNNNPEFRNRLAQNIEECCPELNSIKYTSNHVSGTSLTNVFTANNFPTVHPTTAASIATGAGAGAGAGALLQQDNHLSMYQRFLHDHDPAALVQACKRLESFSADMVTLDHALTEALVGHHGTLRSLTITLHEADPVDRLQEMHCVRRLKSTLDHLSEFGVTWTEPAVPSSSAFAANEDNDMMMSSFIPDRLQDEVTAFLEEPWASSEDLESLTIAGMMVPSLALLTETISTRGGEQDQQNQGLATETDDDSDKKELKPEWRAVQRSLVKSSSSGSLSSCSSVGSNKSAFQSEKKLMQALIVMSLHHQHHQQSALPKLKHLRLNRTAYERIPLDNSNGVALSIL